MAVRDSETTKEPLTTLQHRDGTLAESTRLVFVARGCANTTRLVIGLSWAVQHTHIIWMFIPHVTGAVQYTYVALVICNTKSLARGFGIVFAVGDNDGFVVLSALLQVQQSGREHRLMK